MTVRAVCDILLKVQWNQRYATEDGCVIRRTISHSLSQIQSDAKENHCWYILINATQLCKQLFLVISYYNCCRLKLPYAHDSTPSIVHYFESKLRRGICLNISLYTPTAKSGWLHCSYPKEKLINHSKYITSLFIEEQTHLSGLLITVC